MTEDNPRHIIPSFIIIGERKCGTSSLYRYLTEHPAILPCRLKEPQFFSNPQPFIQKYWQEYLNLFPLEADNRPAVLDWPELTTDQKLVNQRLSYTRKPGIKYITGEASANLLWEADPVVLAEALPDIKLIAIFREPASRAWSHFRMFQRFQEEGRAINMDLSDFRKVITDEIRQFTHGSSTEFIGPGAYIQSINKWMKAFPRDQFRFFLTDDLDRPEAPEMIDELGQWLGLAAHTITGITERRYNQAPARPMPRDCFDLLRDFYTPFDRELEAFLQRPLPWLKSDGHV